MDFLPAEIAYGASFIGNEYAWTISAFLEALAKAPSYGFACLGGQFQFRLPGGIYEMYWLSADATGRQAQEAWRDYSQRSCSEVMTKFEAVASSTDFVREATNWRLLASALEGLVFAAYFATESQFAELSVANNKR